MKRIEIGTILSYSWGYEQTNVDFFQVVKVTAKTVQIREIDKKTEYDNNLRGINLPKINSFKGEPMRKKVNVDGDKEYINMDHGIAKVWNGKKQNISYYA